MPAAKSRKTCTLTICCEDHQTNSTGSRECCHWRSQSLTLHQEASCNISWNTTANVMLQTNISRVESTLRLFILPSNDRSGTLDSRSWHRCNQTASCLLERRLWLFRHQGWVHAAFKGTHTVECQLQNLERLALQQFAARIIRQTPLVLENAVTGAANHSRFTKKHLATSHEIQQQMLCFKPTSAE